MKNALQGLIVLLGVSFSINCCREDHDMVEYLAQQTVTLEGHRGWQLVVADDGSGKLSYQSITNSEARWPAATFAFDKIRWLPPFEPKEREHYPFYWTYKNLQTTECQRYGLPDTSWAVAWFEQAHQKLEQSFPPVPRRLQKQWLREPPIGVKNQ